MMGDLILDTQWLAGDDPSSAKDAALAELTIRLCDRVLTEVFDTGAKTQRDYVRLSVYPLACWLVENWWRLRWEPKRTGTDWRMSHCFAAIGEGYVWPHVTVFNNGDGIQFSSKRTDQSTVGLVRYLNDLQCTVSPASFENGVDRFLGGVMDRLYILGIGDAYLHAIYTELQAELRDPVLRAIRRREALLGFDPGDAPESMLRALTVKADLMGDGGVDEVIADKRQESVDALDAFHVLLTGQDVISFAPPFDGSRPRVPSGSSPWMRGAINGTALRSALGLGLEPIDTRKLAEIVDVSETLVTEEPETHVSAAIGLKDRDTSRYAIALHRQHETSRRFEIARLLGDAMIYGSAEERLLYASDARTERQKVQRAFALEFLCPFDALKHELHGVFDLEDTKIDDVAARYGVSDWAVRNTLENRGLIEA